MSGYARISIHALLAESDGVDGSGSVATSKISIHALLAESDYIRSNVPNFSSISIHALLAESDGAATLAKYQYLHFYPRSPCGERLFRQNYECFEWIISIHALLAESDNINK